MIKLTASTFVANGSLWLYLNNRLITSNSSSVTVAIEEDGEYIVHWFVMGSPGSSYSVTISSPRDVEYQLMRVVSNGGIELDCYRFNTARKLFNQTHKPTTYAT